ncbi:hypothetical protein BB561_003419 [Smittium simulii]|uniref:RGS domain-containing protein n=1 Tax=Smittium simulii TaxID=133385 RepID=A0A2T9YLG5_9FUNG|nr:hypothetical protein BB561_003419 [Smittium simulii]
MSLIPLLNTSKSREDDQVLYNHKENLWTPFATLNPPIGLRKDFNSRNAKQYRIIVKKATSLEKCLDLQATYPLCVFGYSLYLEQYEKNPQDLEFILDVCYLEKLAKASIEKKQRKLNKFTRAQQSSLLDDNTDLYSTYGYPDNFIADDLLNTRLINRTKEYNEQRSNAIENRCLSHNICQKYAEKYDSVRVHSRCYEAPTLLNSIYGSVSDNKRSTGLHQFLNYEEIYLKYITQNASNEIFIPDKIRNEARAVRRLARVSKIDLIKPAKNYVMCTMQQETYPRFVLECMRHNITPKRAFFRVCAGLFLLTCGLTTILSLILIGTQPRAWRILSLPGFFCGNLLILEFWYRLDLFYAFFELSGLFSNTQLDKIRDKSVIASHKLLAIKIFVLSIIFSALLLLIFYFIPGANL